MKKFLKVFSLLFVVITVLSSCASGVLKETYVQEDPSGHQKFEFSYKNNIVDKVETLAVAEIPESQIELLKGLEKYLEDISKEEGIDASFKLDKSKGEMKIDVDFSKLTDEKIKALIDNVGGASAVMGDIFIFKGKDKEFVKTKMEKDGFKKK